MKNKFFILWKKPYRLFGQPSTSWPHPSVRYNPMLAVHLCIEFTRNLVKAQCRIQEFWGRARKPAFLTSTR